MQDFFHPHESPRFDYPTLTALADYVSEQLLPDSPAPVARADALPRAAPALSGESEHLAVLGGACHLPGAEWKMDVLVKKLAMLMVMVMAMGN